MTERDGVVSNPERWRTWAKRIALGSAAVAGAVAYTRERKNGRELQASVDRMKYDPIVPDCYTPAGLQERLLTDRELQGEIAQGEVGLLMLDVRALKYLNDRNGRPAGDKLLADTGGRLRDVADNTLRRHSRPVTEDRRRPGAAQEDILWRAGGDEFYVIVPSVDQDQFETVVERTRQRFGVEQAIQDCRDGVTPIIASVASVHASETGPWLEELVREVDERHLPLKNEQYDEMWHAVVQVEPDRIRPADHRDVIGIFLGVCCPGFEGTLRHDG